ncbi:PKD domain-containing protein [Candidatus Woesearchaeota archaeon]|nr:PKD domain-containing protein [Candidatus Woesearchaeota archaeon]MCF7900717.1 PKD domain-containing protein [Candidatus Woesearchaeota archaeon]MCF8013238.1 PKD domain-containing protein [Candidatus Woesearchaeota archaeon]
MKQKKGQSSIEFLLVIGLITLLLIPAIYYFMTSMYGTNSEIIASQLNKLGTEVLSSSREMYILGEESWSTIEVNIPEEVTNVRLEGGKALVFTYSTQAGTSQSVAFADGYEFVAGPTKTETCTTCNLSISPGKNSFRIESSDGIIWIKTKISDTEILNMCGNGVSDEDEECDKGINNGNIGNQCTLPIEYNSDCEYCDSNCLYVNELGPFCGDELITNSEECDGTNHGGNDCESITGKTSGILSCNSDCTFDTSGCNNNALNANFKTTPNPIIKGEPMQFTDTTNHPQIKTWEWYFNSETTPFSTEKNPAYTFSTEGDYQIKLIVTGNTGLGSDEITKTITVVKQLDVDFEYTPDPIYTNQEIIFTDITTYPENSETEYFEWNIDGEEIAIDTNTITHTFTETGEHTITYAVGLVDGDKDFEIKTVNVLDPIICNNDGVCDLSAGETGQTCTDCPCGNNIINTNEECDDGNNNNNDGCTEICEIEYNYEPDCGPGDTQCDFILCVQTTTNAAEKLTKATLNGLDPGTWLFHTDVISTNIDGNQETVDTWYFEKNNVIIDSSCKLNIYWPDTFPTNIVDPTSFKCNNINSIPKNYASYEDQGNGYWSVYEEFTQTLNTEDEIKAVIDLGDENSVTYRTEGWCAVISATKQT